MPSLVGQPWFWPTLAVVVGLPVVLIVLTELGSNLERRGNPAHTIVRLARNFVVPSVAVAVLLAEITRAVGSSDFTVAKLFATLFGFLVILLVLNAFNFALFTNAREGSWRDRLPSIFTDIARIILIAIGLAVLFSVVWGTDVGGLFTALGVTSIVLGLALQGAIGSVVSGLLLLFEQPFRLGDHLDTGGARGRVVEVNWRAVHIDTGNGIQIVPNATLAGASFTNLSRGGSTYTVATTVTFTTDDPPAQVTCLLRAVAGQLPDLAPGTVPVAVPTGGAAYELTFEVAGPEAEGNALAVLRTRLWYAARREGLALDGDTTDAFVTPERATEALRSIAPLLHLTGDDSVALQPVVRLKRYAAGETVFTAGVVPRSILFVLAGAASLAVPLADGGLVPVTRVDAGDYLGQTALTRETLLTTAVALSELAVLEVPVTSLDELVRARPRLAREVGEVIERRRVAAMATLREFGATPTLGQDARPRA
ncbi:Miniconductance mechanosensitive channel MscM [Frondihabitans sp. 762G35]|uniref:mechanosensitive ion channel domain-containing protein n=1 Tax=Frondihabitans sp. 762G35 TaxID=1446794 RepID=UPI000D20A5ED|nr:mechanosensitive ion channel domain-containing protein [Frondihabitans sp. 762G35]ARC56248.1 Miniconductance mechanosensitive channel MscM [Frondihabitans sp. 762G35]